MANILFIEKYPLKYFFIRRFSRIYPALLVISVTMYIVTLLLIRKGVQADALIEPIELVAALTFWTNYAVAILDRSSFLDHTWSIAVEEHSYIFLAIIAFLSRRNKKIVLIAISGAAFLALLNCARLV